MKKCIFSFFLKQLSSVVKCLALGVITQTEFFETFVNKLKQTYSLYNMKNNTR